jgi:hypothetical protein
MTIEISDEQPAKASDSIRSSFELDSNITSRRELQYQKHFEQRTVTHRGIQIDESDEQDPKTADSIREIFD